MALLEASPWEQEAGITRVESCQARWMFDLPRMRYHRGPKDIDLDIPPPESAWMPYVALEIDADTGDFAVVLNSSRTRVLRSHMHDVACPHCASA